MLMSTLRITIANGPVVEVEEGAPLSEVLSQAEASTDGPVVAGIVNGKEVDLSYRLNRDSHVEFIPRSSPKGQEIHRHSASHVMAQAVKTLFPEAKVTIGPAIEDGFYYDFDLDHPFTPEDIDRIEAKMRELVAEDQPFVRREMPRDEAIKYFRDRAEPYKVELLTEMEDSVVSLYGNGDFVDLCRGPHLPSTGLVGHFKLTSVAGAYWRGDERKKMLQRIYGTAFPSAEELEAYLRRVEEIRRRDHRILGRRLDIYSVHEEAGPGLIHWHPKGAILRRVIERLWEDEHLKRGYQLVNTPHIARDVLFHASGHYEFYREHMFTLAVESDEYVLKPMNCPGHIMIYKAKQRSYRDLPIRYAELGTVYRYERSGVLHGMLRVRGFTQDDAHIFCTPEQAQDEILGVIDLASFMLKVFGYRKFEVDLSVRDPAAPDEYAGSSEQWDMAERALRRALEERGLPYTRREGEAVFYGPKIDIKMMDALGRGWQGPTIQFDFNLPSKLDVAYIGPDGKASHVVMIHRTVLGSMERFVGSLLEHYGGAFPLWLAPVQVRVLTITDRQVPFGRTVVAALAARGLRVEEDFRNEKIGYKISEAERTKIPCMLVIGDREAESGSVSVRVRGRDLGVRQLDGLLEELAEEIAARRPASDWEE